MKVLVRWLPAIFLCGFIFYWSNVPGVVINERGLGNETLHQITHFSMFFLLTLAFNLATQNLFYAFVLTMLFAISDEIHQSYVPLRSASIFDIYVDMLGALSAAGLWNIFQNLYKKLMRSRKK